MNTTVAAIVISVIGLATAVIYFLISRKKSYQIKQKQTQSGNGSQKQEVNINE